MDRNRTTSRGSCQRKLPTVPTVLAVLALAAAVTAPARADAGNGPTQYQGAFWGAQLHSGVVFRSAAGPGEDPAPVLGVSLRAATLMSLLDVQLTWLTAAWEVTATDHPPASVRRHSVGVSVHLHPFFLSHLENSNHGFWLGGIYLAVGGDLDLIGLSAPGIDRTTPAFGFHVGAGTDVPLGDVIDDWGIWLGVAYRLKILGHHPSAPGLGHFDEHAFLITLAYRNNDIGFARFPRPAELDDREPLTH